MPGTGRPTVPSRAFSPCGLALTTGEVSVRPYPSVTVTPVRLFQRSATDDTSAVPPELVPLSAEKSIFLNSGCDISATNRVFSPRKPVNRHFCSSLTKPLMSRGLVISTLWLPVTIMHMQFTVNA